MLKWNGGGVVAVLRGGTNHGVVRVDGELGERAVPLVQDRCLFGRGFDLGGGVLGEPRAEQALST